MEPKSNKTVSVVIVTCVTDNYLAACLDSVGRQSRKALETIVIDNAQNIDFSRSIIEHYPNIKLYSQERGLSFCESVNLGISLSNGDFILCLNDDVTLEDRFIEEALKGFSIDSKVGMVSGKLLRRDKQTIDSAGLVLSYFRTARERGYGLKDAGKFEKAGFIFGVTGAAAFYKREMLENIRGENGYFDSGFHLFYEDLDAAWRANRLGWRGYYVPGAVGYHVRGGSVRKRCGINKPFARRYLSDELNSDLIRNRYLAIIKNESGIDFLLCLPGILTYDLMAWAYILLFRPAVLKIFLSNSSYLKKALKKRFLRR